MGMAKESITQNLLRRLDGAVGQHTLIAKECGIGQATISRIYQRKASPRLEIADKILAWFDRQDQALKRRKLAPRITGGKAVRRNVGATASLGH
jgi:DNA transposition AAA+ family ATPase